MSTRYDRRSLMNRSSIVLRSREENRREVRELTDRYVICNFPTCVRREFSDDRSSRFRSAKEKNSVIRHRTCRGVRLVAEETRPEVSNEVRETLLVPRSTRSFTCDTPRERSQVPMSPRHLHSRVSSGPDYTRFLHSVSSYCY